MHVPETLKGGPVHDGLTLEAGGIRVRNDGLGIGLIRASAARGCGHGPIRREKWEIEGAVDVARSRTGEGARQTTRDQGNQKVRDTYPRSNLDS